jgi:hypothetical protein
VVTKDFLKYLRNENVFPNKDTVFSELKIWPLSLTQDENRRIFLRLVPGQ